MRPIKTLLSNHNFGPPTNVTDGSIGDLPCEIVETDRGRYVYSVWELSDDDRQGIANGWNIRLGVGWIGGYPPTSLGVTHEQEVTEPVEDAPAT